MKYFLQFNFKIRVNLSASRYIFPMKILINLCYFFPDICPHMDWYIQFFPLICVNGSTDIYKNGFLVIDEGNPLEISCSFKSELYFFHLQNGYPVIHNLLILVIKDSI